MFKQETKCIHWYNKTHTFLDLCHSKSYDQNRPSLSIHVSLRQVSILMDILEKNGALNYSVKYMKYTIRDENIM